jgi:hypothetical protein
VLVRPSPPLSKDSRGHAVVKRPAAFWREKRRSVGLLSCLTSHGGTSTLSHRLGCVWFTLTPDLISLQVHGRMTRHAPPAMRFASLGPPARAVAGAAPGAGGRRYRPSPTRRLGERCRPVTHHHRHHRASRTAHKLALSLARRRRNTARGRHAARRTDRRRSSAAGTLTLPAARCAAPAATRSRRCG